MTEQFKGEASIYAFSERVLRSNSVTDELERWCLEHEIGDGQVVALCDRDSPREAIDDESLEILSTYKSVGKVRFRRVRLATAGVALVDALNWYFPGNLSRDICDMLETTDVPFGRAVRCLSPKRRTFFMWRATAAQLVNQRGRIDPASIAFEHRAIVYRDNNVPLAVVRERFRVALFLPARGFAATAALEVPNAS